MFIIFCCLFYYFPLPLSATIFTFVSLDSFSRPSFLFLLFHFVTRFHAARNDLLLLLPISLVAFILSLHSFWKWLPLFFRTAASTLISKHQHFYSIITFVNPSNALSFSPSLSPKIDEFCWSIQSDALDIIHVRREIFVAQFDKIFRWLKWTTLYVPSCTTALKDLFRDQSVSLPTLHPCSSVSNSASRSLASFLFRLVRQCNWAVNHNSRKFTRYTPDTFKVSTRDRRILLPLQTFDNWVRAASHVCHP